MSASPHNTIDWPIESTAITKQISFGKKKISISLSPVKPPFNQYGKFPRIKFHSLLGQKLPNRTLTYAHQLRDEPRCIITTIKTSHQYLIITYLDEIKIPMMLAKGAPSPSSEKEKSLLDAQNGRGTRPTLSAGHRRLDGGKRCDVTVRENCHFWGGLSRTKEHVKRKSEKYEKKVCRR